MGINIFALIIGAIFVNNVVLAQFLGICPFLGVSKDVKSSIGMGGAVLFVMLLATLVTCSSASFMPPALLWVSLWLW